MRKIVIVPVLLAGCDLHRSGDPSPAPSSAPTDAASIVPVPHEVPPAPRCDAPVPIFDAGIQVGSICEREATAAGLTVIDLSSGWTPRLFAPNDDDAGPAYRQTWIALADERLGDGPEWDRARADRFLELYGIAPTFRVLRARLEDEERHRCHDGVDDRPLSDLTREVDLWAERDRQRAEAAETRKLERRLDAMRIKRGAVSVDVLRSAPDLALVFKQYDAVATKPRAIAATQAHLRCERLLVKRAEEGVFDRPSVDALLAFQRKHMIVSFGFDADTREMLATDSRELDFRGMLRALRERVVDAAGLIEDGSATGRGGFVVDRVLDSRAFRARPSELTNASAAPDLVAAATDAAARALGWTSPGGARAFFDGFSQGEVSTLRVALRLPPVPAYYGPEMELRAEIDRGDIWYDFPYGASGALRRQPIEHRPSITLYAKHAGGETALLRWGTTIGGWKPERARGEIVLSYKLSPPGPRVWRDLFAGPAWIPPDSTPKRELIRSRGNGAWATKDDLFGPGYASAYGLMMLVHQHETGRGDGGIRTHGSVSYDSIHHGTSHGCHRVFNHLAVRLGSFLLAHRRHVRKGDDTLGYTRRFEWQGKTLDLTFASRGYRFELDPPVPVDVLPGRIMGKQISPMPDQELPDSMRKLFRTELEE